MSKFKAGFLGAVTLGLGMLAAGSPAYAITNFTWNPSGAGVGLSNAGSFTADNITVKDYAVINIPANPTVLGSITENGTLAFTSYAGLSGTLNGFVPGTGNPADAVSGATPYQLYISFTSTSHLTGGGGVFSGAFDSLSYSLIGDVGGNCDFSPTGISGCGGDAQITLATGALSNAGLNQVTIINGIPAANVQLTFNPTLPGFFVSPTNVTLAMEGAFTNTCGAVGGTTPTSGPNKGKCVLPNPSQISINGGGGNLDFLATPNRVPEPGSLWLLGAGLLGLAGMSRIRARS